MMIMIVPTCGDHDHHHRRHRVRPTPTPAAATGRMNEGCHHRLQPSVARLHGRLPNDFGPRPRLPGEPGSGVAWWGKAEHIGYDIQVIVSFFTTHFPRSRTTRYSWPAAARPPA